MRTALLALVLLGCGTTGDTDETPSRKSVYTTSLCRLYSEPACVTSQDDSCGFSLSFDTVSDCTLLYNLGWGGCDGLADAMEGNADVDACITALDALDCATDPICDTNSDFIAGGAPCAAVQVIIDSHCPDDSGL